MTRIRTRKRKRYKEGDEAALEVCTTIIGLFGIFAMLMALFNYWVK
jgi:hypothetical protein